MIGLREGMAAWPLLVFALGWAVAGLRTGRRRSALNEALHELRRPLQALALAGGSEQTATVRLAAAALERLDCEINGRAQPSRRTTIEVHALVEAAVRRWQGRARLCHASLNLREEARAEAIEGDPTALGQALDNLVVNAIEHGGPRIVVRTRSTNRSLRISVLDSGPAARAPSGTWSPSQARATMRGSRSRGHGLNVVRRVAAAHAGRFWLRTRPQGSAAVIELPLARSGDDRAA